MLGRRGSSFGLQLFSVAIVLVMFVYGFYLYKNVSSQLENVEKDNAELVLEKEELSRDIQVLRESKTKLEQMLKDKENTCSMNEERLGVEIKKIRDDLSREKMSCEERASTWSNERMDLKQQIQELHDKLDETEAEVKSLRDEAFELRKAKQESLNDVAKLNDDVANLKRKVIDLNKFKDLHESKDQNHNQTKNDVKKENKVDDDDQMQIKQPEENQGYYKIHSAKPRNQEEFEKDYPANKSLDKQVAPPSIEKKGSFEKIRDHPEGRQHFDPDLPIHRIPKHDEVDVGGADQVEKPDFKAREPEKKVEGIKEVEDGNGAGDDNFGQADDKAVPERGDALDDEDMVEDGDRGVLQGQKMPEADDTELKPQRHDSEP